MLIRSAVTIACASALALYLTGCGGGGDPTTKTGVFVDSAVANINYKTATLSGKTDANGGFSYVEGETVTFSIGDADLPSAYAKQTMSPLDLVGTTDFDNQAVINIARLLQSIDMDGNPSNGISIGDAAHASATGLILDFASPTFDADIANLVANSGSVTTELVDVQGAIDHLRATVYGAPDKFSMEWLSGKTLYQVWFGAGVDQNGNGIENVPVVRKAEFGADGVLNWTGLLNYNSGNITYRVNTAGMLFFDDDTTSGNTIMCGGAPQYLKTHHIENSVFDNVDLFFYNESDAMSYTASLTSSIPPCDQGSRQPEAVTHTGTFSGSDSGTFTVQVAPDGTITGSLYSNDLRATFALQGTASAGGSFTSGVADTGGVFTGRIEGSTISGTWVNDYYDESGTFIGSEVIDP